jgi:phosphatidylserine/phosphatidylglycerophosphate/cardiolipin synthase-like enzyme
MRRNRVPELTTPDPWSPGSIEAATDGSLAPVLARPSGNPHHQHLDPSAAPAASGFCRGLADEHSAPAVYDGIGSWCLNREFLPPMIDQGIRVSPFLPGRSLRERWSINLRNHRKLVIVDNRTAFTGGLNVGDEYLGRDPDWGYWRDTHRTLQGPEVSQLVAVFAEVWYCATHECQRATSCRRFLSRKHDARPQHGA